MDSITLHARPFVRVSDLRAVVALLLCLPCASLSAQVVRWAKALPSAGAAAEGLDVAWTSYGWPVVVGRRGLLEPHAWMARLTADGDLVWELEDSGVLHPSIISIAGFDYFIGVGKDTVRTSDTTAWTVWDTVRVTALLETGFTLPAMVAGRGRECPIASVELRDSTAAIVMVQGDDHDVRKVRTDGSTVWRHNLGRFPGDRTRFVNAICSLSDGGVAGVWDFGLVFRLSADGDSVWQISHLVRNPQCIREMSDGTILVGGQDSVGGCVLRIDGAGREVARWHPTLNGYSVDPQQFLGDGENLVVLGHVYTPNSTQVGVARPALLLTNPFGAISRSLVVYVSDSSVYMNAISTAPDGWILTGYKTPPRASWQSSTELMAIRVGMTAAVEVTGTSSRLDLR